MSSNFLVDQYLCELCNKPVEPCYGAKVYHMACLMKALEKSRNKLRESNNGAVVEVGKANS